jgi:excisionase family DNA binding protein
MKKKTPKKNLWDFIPVNNIQGRKEGCQVVEKRYLNVREISEYLGFKPSSIRGWVRKGAIPFNKVNGGIRFDIIRVDKWIIQQSRGFNLSNEN